MSRRQKTWTWLPSLFGAGEIPAATVTFVALLMFLQIQTSPTVATGCCGCLFLPWVLRSFLRNSVARWGNFRVQLILCEWLLTGAFWLLSQAFRLHEGRIGWMFAALLLLSLLSVWHELVAKMYYERMLNLQEQRRWNSAKMCFSQISVVLTYGLLIMMVGALQVFNRAIVRSWAEGCSLLAILFGLFALWHTLRLAPARRKEVVQSELFATGNAGSQHYGQSLFLRLQGMGRHVALLTLSLFLLLLPQSLMFYSRTLFLLLPQEAGGLECTIQEVGFAQGTVGVIAFSVALALGRQLMEWIGVERIFWLMAVSLGLSPIVYLLMAFDPPTSLPSLCLATMQAQFSFGFGLPLCMHYVRNISGERYRNTINYLYIPLVAFVMLLPMAVSGWLVELLGFRIFFVVDTATSLLAWLFLIFAPKPSQPLISNK